MRLKKVYLPSGELDVTQHHTNSCCLSYNPDDGKFYVSKNKKTAGIFTEFRNASYYYKKLAGLTNQKGQ